MNIVDFEKICNKRNCVERITLNYFKENKDINEIINVFLKECNIERNNITKDKNEILSYCLYTCVLDKYIRRGNVCYENMKEILNMLDKSKDTISLYVNSKIDIREFTCNLNEFKEWIGISIKFDEFICSSI